MADLIRKPKTTVVTKDGECEIHITLDINLTINGGKIQTSDEEEKPLIPKQKDDVDWVIPSFGNSEKIKLK